VLPRKRCHTARRYAPISGFRQSTTTSLLAPAFAATPSSFRNLPAASACAGGDSGGTEDYAAADNGLHLAYNSAHAGILI